jgi:FAD/FMN-containing dehydrogenase
MADQLPADHPVPAQIALQNASAALDARRAHELPYQAARRHVMTEDTNRDEVGNPTPGALAVDPVLLKRNFSGQIILPGDRSYDASRSVWNAMVDRRPALIARCVTVDDVSTAVRFARDAGLEIGIRCGGHSVSGLAVSDGGLMVDLSLMGSVHVDVERRRAYVQGGALLGALDRATQPYGLATTAGNVSHTGVGGLTLGGGMGWLARQYGLACDNVRAIQLVTADGEVVRANESENADLFWGLRGGGGNFGIATEFEFELHYVGTQALLVECFYHPEHAAPALRRWRDLIPAAPRQATLTAWVGTTGDVPFLSPELHRRPLVSVGFVWVGDPAEGRQLVAPLRDPGPSVAQRVTELSYLNLQSMDDDELEAPALRRYWKGHYLRELSDDALEAFVMRGAKDFTDADHQMLPYANLQTYGGAIGDVPDSATAFSHRDALVEFVATARWTDPREDEDRIAAARRYGAAVEPYTSGAYVNSLSDEGQTGVRRAYSTDKLARLTALKNRYDPDNVFHLNHNIKPTHGSGV